VLVTRVLGRRVPRMRDAEETPPAIVNGLLAALSTWEARRQLRWPLGSSLAAVCERP